ncbi:hypothetical protein DERF_013534 [Dermatophagoides farinae]|uniref:Uncharacterized protein n=1 Tax=Dermatophagoides farinae TaxID=6954 RepID=A0A922HMP6_DERFA|nr:hypothetical protein DERF_013534 [Dermatophagoides farinae]
MVHGKEKKKYFQLYNILFFLSSLLRYITTNKDGEEKKIHNQNCKINVVVKFCKYMNGNNWVLFFFFIFGNLNKHLAD